jgi:hypothetical protein
MRERIAHDASSQQSPDVVAAIMLREIIEKPDERDQELFVIRNGALQRIAIETL